MQRGMKRSLILFLIIIVISYTLSFAGCGEEPPPAASEIKEKTLAALPGLKTYQINTDMNIEMSGTVKGEESGLSIEIMSKGTVDLEKRKIMMSIDSDVAEYPEQIIPPEQSVRLYYIDNVMYIRAEAIFGDADWRKTSPDDILWEEINHIQFQTDLLKASTVEYMGTEDYNGEECYVLRLSPDIKENWELLARHALMSGQFGVFMPFDKVESLPWTYSLKLWIARNTSFITGMEAAINVEIPRGNDVIPDEEGTVSLTMNSLTFDHNKTVNIELSPEAEAAILES
jgi:hypothetical protein